MFCSFCSACLQPQLFLSPPLLSFLAVSNGCLCCWLVDIGQFLIYCSGRACSVYEGKARRSQRRRHVVRLFTGFAEQGNVWNTITKSVSVLEPACLCVDTYRRLYRLLAFKSQTFCNCGYLPLLKCFPCTRSTLLTLNASFDTFWRKVAHVLFFP